jgi:hypothetical protein
MTTEAQTQNAPSGQRGRRERPAVAGAARKPRRIQHGRADGQSHPAALTGGYHLAFLVGAIFAAVAAALGGLLLYPRPTGAATADETAGELAPCNSFSIGNRRSSEQVA